MLSYPHSLISSSNTTPFLIQWSTPIMIGSLSQHCLTCKWDCYSIILKPVLRYSKNTEDCFHNSDAVQIFRGWRIKSLVFCWLTNLKMDYIWLSKRHSKILIIWDLPCYKTLTLSDIIYCWIYGLWARYLSKCFTKNLGLVKL